MRRLSLLFAALVVAVPLAAQEKPPDRPKLPTGLDTLDSRAYYQWGNRPEVDWKKTHAAYYWAARLEPDDYIYLWAQSVALLGRQSPAWRANYRNHTEYVAKSKEAKRIDSVNAEVYIRNPFPSYSRTCYLTEGLERQRNRLLVAVIEYDNGCYARAIEAYGEALAKDSSILWAHMDLANANYFLRRYDDAVGELQIVLDSLRARDAEYLSRFYESKAMFEYMVGVVYLRAQRWEPAREAFGRALTEDLSFYMAHARLADIAAYERRPETAATEYGLAVELKPENGVMRYDYGEALVRLQRFDEAEPQLREAIRLEPYWAAPYFQLGLSLEGQEKFTEAAAAFKDFIARCPKRLHRDADEARTHIEDVQQKVAAGGTSPQSLR
jgi:tetratricopeptide (TPR) repeat protein